MAHKVFIAHSAVLVEIRRLIEPICNLLEDHSCVNAREFVSGMGKVHSWFHSHQWPESNDNQMSKQNATEADLITAFFDYGVENGLSPKR
jgi:helicase required for RNAi-mediated heterochromatin assembly 1